MPSRCAAHSAITSISCGRSCCGTSHRLTTWYNKFTHAKMYAAEAATAHSHVNVCSDPPACGGRRKFGAYIPVRCKRIARICEMPAGTSPLVLLRHCAKHPLLDKVMHRFTLCYYYVDYGLRKYDVFFLRVWVDFKCSHMDGKRTANRPEWWRRLWADGVCCLRGNLSEYSCTCFSSIRWCCVFVTIGTWNDTCESLFVFFVKLFLDVPIISILIEDDCYLDERLGKKKLNKSKYISKTDNLFNVSQSYQFA